ncbi:MAG: hypothetical protein A2X12_02510 [Bacteroidetes bacterium GWE2_29_8]|nr:MAG: hypothetical protein A2X12_02510 [Bacteroidetes bacterium GWE2_29_8]OFY23054.1 MAG: hypothetical protein A2X02_09490 [Bacteroidetes bacterium GWF2_29_10]HBY21636.1 hydrolase [Clostridiales bacterium]
MYRAFLFDWGDTLMRDFPNETGPMFQWEKVETMPNVLETLEILSLKSNIYLATNAIDSNKIEIIAALKRVNIHKYFSDIFCYKDIGYKKPSQEYFARIISILKVKPIEVVMIGDNLNNDIIGSNKFGINSILYDLGNKYPDYKGKKIKDLLELATL